METSIFSHIMGPVLWSRGASCGPDGHSSCGPVGSAAEQWPQSRHGIRGNLERLESGRSFHDIFMICHLWYVLMIFEWYLKLFEWYFMDLWWVLMSSVSAQHQKNTAVWWIPRWGRSTCSPATAALWVTSSLSKTTRSNGERRTMRCAGQLSMESYCCQGLTVRILSLWFLWQLYSHIYIYVYT